MLSSVDPRLKIDIDSIDPCLMNGSKTDYQILKDAAGLNGK